MMPCVFLSLLFFAITVAVEVEDSEVKVITKSVSFKVGNMTLYGATLGKTSFGKDGPTRTCALGQYVKGFRVKAEGNRGPAGDDTALNSIEFVCGDGVTMKSGEGKWGGWKAWKNCKTGEYIDGVMFRSEPYKGLWADDTAGNDLRARCTDGEWLEGGSGVSWGGWDAYYCPEGNKVCGLQTRVEGPQGVPDDTALNQLTSMCCL